MARSRRRREKRKSTPREGQRLQILKTCKRRLPKKSTDNEPHSEPKRRRTNSYNLRHSNSVILVEEIPCCSQEQQEKYKQLGLNTALFLNGSRRPKRKQSHISIITISSDDEETSEERTHEWINNLDENLQTEEEIEDKTDSETQENVARSEEDTSSQNSSFPNPAKKNEPFHPLCSSTPNTSTLSFQSPSQNHSEELKSNRLCEIITENSTEYSTEYDRLRGVNLTEYGKKVAPPPSLKSLSRYYMGSFKTISMQEDSDKNHTTTSVSNNFPNTSFKLLPRNYTGSLETLAKEEEDSEIFATPAPNDFPNSLHNPLNITKKAKRSGIFTMTSSESPTLQQQSTSSNVGNTDSTSSNNLFKRPANPVGFTLQRNNEISEKSTRQPNFVFGSSTSNVNTSTSPASPLESYFKNSFISYLKNSTTGENKTPSPTVNENPCENENIESKFYFKNPINDLTTSETKSPSTTSNETICENENSEYDTTNENNVNDETETKLNDSDHPDDNL